LELRLKYKNSNKHKGCPKRLTSSSAHKKITIDRPRRKKGITFPITSDIKIIMQCSKSNIMAI
jgi:hypothetical protein